MESSTGSVQRRPGGRTADTTRRVNAAVLELLTEGGVEACTVSAVAARAGVERSTLYRRYPNRWAVIIDAIADKAEEEITSSDKGSFRADLETILTKLAAVLQSPLGAALLMVAAAMKEGAAPDQSDRFWTLRSAQLRPMFDAAVARGELRSDVDREEAFARAAGPVYFRIFISRQPMTETFIAQVAQSVAQAYAA